MNSSSVGSLAVTRLAASENTARNLVMLHGIYGRGRNWHGIARALVTARTDYACWMVDLPHHGDSGPGTHGDTIGGLAADVAQWLAVNAIVPDAVLGHSYGGKVALALSARRPDTRMQIWVIDSTPETKLPSGSAWGLLDIIRGLPPRFATRDEATHAIMGAGYPLGVAQWMGTNLVRHGSAFAWRLDFDAMERLLRDFFGTDLWNVVEHPSSGHDIHILKASESNAISPDAVARITAAAGSHLHLHLRDGGHWIHAESPEVVVGLLCEHLPHTIGG